MKDFDADIEQRHREREAELGDRTFKLGGETFTYVANVPLDVLENLTSENVLLGGAYIKMVRESCLALVEDVGDQHDRFLAVLKRRGKDAITLDDLQNVFQGLVQEAFRRPTQASSPSGGSDAETGEISTETSSTAPVVGAAV